MDIEQLRIELRPRTNAQALDLGFALLRAHAGAAYGAYLALWLPLIGVCAVLIWAFPAHGQWFGWIAWWLKPLLERAPLYVLSRGVFGTTVTWQEAVRAWPRQLGGGWFRLLTWQRPFSCGRGLVQPVWQLEQARGAAATARRRAIGGHGTAVSAYLFGLACVSFELIVLVGVAALIGIFFAGPDANPFALWIAMGEAEGAIWPDLVGLGLFAVSTAVIGPVYSACCFTLYLNRRATLEAWDIELQLRQIRRPRATGATRAAGRALLSLAVGALLLLPLGAMLAPPAWAAAPQERCQDRAEQRPGAPYPRSPSHGAQQGRVRQQVDALYQGDDLRAFDCVEDWRRKPDAKAPRKRPPVDRTPWMALLASVLKTVFIAAAIGAALYLLYRYRDRLPGFSGNLIRVAATEVGGLDIRAASLPADVPAAVRALWAQGQRRAALALLYRATLSRLVSQDALVLHQGATEGDCQRLARLAHERGQLGADRLAVTVASTALWLSGAYADRWPDDATVEARCSEWAACFGSPGSAP